MLGLQCFITRNRKSWRAAVLGALLVVTVASAAVADARFLTRIHSLEVGGASEFTVAQKFSIGAVIGGRRIATVGPNFATHFGNLVERSVPPASLIAWETRYAMADTTMVQMVGGNRAVATHLSHIHSVMERGSPGASHTDWQSNIAFLRSPISGELWAIHWSVDHSGSWSIGAVTVPHEALDWAAGTRVFSIAVKSVSLSVVGTRAAYGE